MHTGSAGGSVANGICKSRSKHNGASNGSGSQQQHDEGEDLNKFQPTKLELPAATCGFESKLI